MTRFLLLAPIWLFIGVVVVSAIRTKLHGGSLLGEDDTPPDLTQWSDETTAWHRDRAARNSGRGAA